MSRSPVLVLAFLLGCVAEQGPVGGHTEFIVDGVRETGEPAVVLIYNRRGGLCSGSIISPRVVMTAKHCVQSSGATDPDPPSFFQIGVGDSTRSLSETLAAVEIRTTPGVWTSGGGGGLGGALVGQDIALITLARGVDSFMPLDIKRESPVSQTGRPALAFGFGETPAGEVGVKYRGMTTVRGVMGGVIYTGPVTCQGDSGGPIIDPDTREVYGITSFGTGSCGSGLAGANRIDTFLDMIDEVIGASGSCLNDGPERCDGFDNDCNDEIDEGCLALGTACEFSDQCLGNNCADTPGGRICTTECDPLRPVLGCPPGMFCAWVSGCDGVCINEPSDARSRGIGEECTEDAQCTSLFCVDPGDGVRRCLQACRGGAGMCLAGEACAANVDACGGCVPAGILDADRGLGEPCGADEDCSSMACLMEAGTSYCTVDCADDAGCPDGFHCRVDICVRGDREGVGGGCRSNADCADVDGEPGICASRGDTYWCTVFCTVGDDTCPDDFECVDVGGAGVCAPTGRLLGESCMSDDECISRTCADSDGASVCTRLCGPDNPCGPGFECHRTADGTAAVCVAPSPEVAAEDGGCSCSPAGTGRGPGPLGAIVALFAAGLFFRRRR